MDGAIDSDEKGNGSKRNARAPNASAANAAPIPTKPYQRLYQGRLISLESPARRYAWIAQMIATNSRIALPAGTLPRSTNMLPSAMIAVSAKYAAAQPGRATYSIPAGWMSSPRTAAIHFFGLRYMAVGSIPHPHNGSYSISCRFKTLPAKAL